MDRSEYDDHTKEELLDALEEAEDELSGAEDQISELEEELTGHESESARLSSDQYDCEKINEKLRAIHELKRLSRPYEAELDGLICESLGVVL